MTIDPCTDETLLSAFLDDELPPADRRAVADHLDGCIRCRRILADLQAADAALAGLEDPEPSAGFDAAVKRRIAPVARRRRWWRHVAVGWGWRRPLPVALAAAAAVIVLMVVHPRPQAPAVDDVILAGNLAFFQEMELAEHLDLLENWEAVASVKEPTS